jgi:glycosyltransferase involved in cell wall biosynthesis
MRVLIVSEPGLDGVFRHVEGLVRYLVENGIETAFAYSVRRSSDRLFELVNEVERHGGTTLKMDIGNAPGPADVRALYDLWRFAKRFQPDIIHGHSSKAGALVRLLGRMGFGSRAIFYSPHAYFKMHSPTGPKALLFHSVERILGKIGVTFHQFGSEVRFAQTHLGISPSQQAVVLNGVDCDKFSPIDDQAKRTLRNRLGIPPTAKVLGTIGRCSAQKDPQTMYHAVKIAHRDLPDVYFLHLGQGEFAAKVDAILADDRSWSQRLDYSSDPASIYRVLDGFILTSRYEGMSFAMLEAISMDLPLVLSRAPGCTDLEEFGLSHLYWADPGDVEGFAAAIRQWAAGLATSARCNHREIALEKFTEESCCSQIVDIYRAACGRNQKTTRMELI